MFGYTGGVPRPGGFLSNLDSQQLLTYDNLTKVGAYNDNDMLEVCNGGLSFTENRAQFATWVILSSPLILGNNPSTMDAACKEIILNPEVGTPHSAHPTPALPNPSTAHPHPHHHPSSHCSDFFVRYEATC
jgi:hypothetical protein